MIDDSLLPWASASNGGETPIPVSLGSNATEREIFLSLWTVAIQRDIYISVQSVSNSSAKFQAHPETYASVNGVSGPPSLAFRPLLEATLPNGGYFSPF